MACLEMYNSDHKAHHHHHLLHHHNYPPPVSPRISFSNDFADSHQLINQHHLRPTPPPPGSSDFEFSVTDHSMMSGADELFFKGRLLPFKQTTPSSSHRPTTTLRDELLAGDEDRDVTLRPSKGSTGSTRWKSFLGLKKAHNGPNSKKHSEASPSASLSNLSKTSSQDLLNINEGGSTCQDVEIGI